MNCPQKIVLTIKHGHNNTDLELPTEYTIGDLKKSIISALNIFYKEKKIESSLDDNIKLYHNDNQLDESKILANYGIWDGSIIELR